MVPVRARSPVRGVGWEAREPVPEVVQRAAQEAGDLHLGDAELPGKPHVKSRAGGQLAEIKDLPVSPGLLAAGSGLQLVEGHGLKPAVAQVQLCVLQRRVRRDGYASGEDQPAPHVSRGIDSQLGGCAVRRLGRGMLAEYIA